MLVTSLFHEKCFFCPKKQSTLAKTNEEIVYFGCFLDLRFYAGPKVQTGSKKMHRYSISIFKMQRSRLIRENNFNIQSINV